MKSLLILTAVGALALGSQEAMSKPEPLQVFQIEELLEKHADSERSYTGFLRVPALHAGIYTLAAGARDGQSPHGEDEVYYVLKGAGKIRSGDRELPVRKGSIVYVKAKEEHRFTEITEDLELLVLFSTGPTDAPKK